MHGWQCVNSTFINHKILNILKIRTDRARVFTVNYTFFFIWQEFEKDEGLYVLNEKNYDQGVKDISRYVLVYFYAHWCGHCKAFGPGKLSWIIEKRNKWIKIKNLK